jgi:hypothetical protein
MDFERPGIFHAPLAEQFSAFVQSFPFLHETIIYLEVAG